MIYLGFYFTQSLEDCPSIKHCINILLCLQHMTAECLVLALAGNHVPETESLIPAQCDTHHQPLPQTSPDLFLLSVTLTINPFHWELQAKVVLGIHHPVVTGGSDVKHQPPFLCSPDRPGVQQEQIWIPGTKEQNSQSARIPTAVPSLPFPKRRLGWSRAEVLWGYFSLLGLFLFFGVISLFWGYFSVTVNLELLMQLPKTACQAEICRIAVCICKPGNWADNAAH